MDRDSIALAVLPHLVAANADIAAACTQAFAVADAFLEARSAAPVVCIESGGADSQAVAACCDLGRSLFEVELAAHSRTQLVDKVREWVTDGRLPNHEEAAHAMLGGLYDALMEAFAPDMDEVAASRADDVDAEVAALTEMFRLPAVDGTATPDAPSTEEGAEST